MTDDDVLGQARQSAGGDFPDWRRPDGTYEVKLVKLGTMMGKKYQSEEEELKLRFDFVPVGFTGPGTFRLLTNFSTHEKSNLTAVCKALQVPVPGDGEDIRVSAFIGRTCWGVIEHVPSTTRPGQTYPRLTKVFPGAQSVASNGTDAADDVNY